MTLGKGIGGGVPLSALLCTDEVASFEAGDQGGTYNGNPLMTAVGCSVIEQLLAPGFLAGVEERGAYLRKQLLQLSEEFGLAGERGNGLLRALLLIIFGFGVVCDLLGRISLLHQRAYFLIA